MRFFSGKQKSAINKCFTLIELLVVVAIIAVLISILLPALSRARDTAKAVSCNSNFSQVGKAFMMYLQENTDTFPPGQFLVDAATNKWMWWPQLLCTAKYITPKVYQCPAFMNQYLGDFSSLNDIIYNPNSSKPWYYFNGIDVGYNYKNIGSSYHYVGTDVSQMTFVSGDPVYYPARVGSIQNPSQTVLCVDAFNYAWFLGVSNASTLGQTIGSCYVDDSASAIRQYPAHARHASKASVLWADGHASFARCPDMSTQSGRNAVDVTYQVYFGDLGSFAKIDNTKAASENNVMANCWDRF